MRARIMPLRSLYIPGVPTGPGLRALTPEILCPHPYIHVGLKLPLFFLRHTYTIFVERTKFVFVGPPLPPGPRIPTILTISTKLTPNSSYHVEYSQLGLTSGSRISIWRSYNLLTVWGQTIRTKSGVRGIQVASTQTSQQPKLLKHVLPRLDFHPLPETPTLKPIASPFMRKGSSPPTCKTST